MAIVYFVLQLTFIAFYTLSFLEVVNIDPSIQTHLLIGAVWSSILLKLEEESKEYYEK